MIAKTYIEPNAMRGFFDRLQQAQSTWLNAKDAFVRGIPGMFRDGYDGGQKSADLLGHQVYEHIRHGAAGARAHFQSLGRTLANRREHMSGSERKAVEAVFEVPELNHRAVLQVSLALPPVQFDLLRAVLMQDMQIREALEAPAQAVATRRRVEAISTAFEETLNLLNATKYGNGEAKLKDFFQSFQSGARQNSAAAALLLPIEAPPPPTDKPPEVAPPPPQPATPRPAAPAAKPAQQPSGGTTLTGSISAASHAAPLPPQPARDSVAVAPPVAPAVFPPPPYPQPGAAGTSPHPSPLLTASSLLAQPSVALATVATASPSALPIELNVPELTAALGNWAEKLAAFRAYESTANSDRIDQSNQLYQLAMAAKTIRRWTAEGARRIAADLGGSIQMGLVEYSATDRVNTLRAAPELPSGRSMSAPQAALYAELSRLDHGMAVFEAHGSLEREEMLSHSTQAVQIFECALAGESGHEGAAVPISAAAVTSLSALPAALEPVQPSEPPIDFPELREALSNWKKRLVAYSEYEPTVEPTVKSRFPQEGDAARAQRVSTYISQSLPWKHLTAAAKTIRDETLIAAEKMVGDQGGSIEQVPSVYHAAGLRLSATPKLPEGNQMLVQHMAAYAALAELDSGMCVLWARGGQIQRPAMVAGAAESVKIFEARLAEANAIRIKEPVRLAGDGAVNRDGHRAVEVGDGVVIAEVAGTAGATSVNGNAAAAATVVREGDSAPGKTDPSVSNPFQLTRILSADERALISIAVEMAIENYNIGLRILLAARKKRDAMSTNQADGNGTHAADLKLPSVMESMGEKAMTTTVKHLLNAVDGFKDVATSVFEFSGGEPIKGSALEVNSEVDLNPYGAAMRIQDPAAAQMIVPAHIAAQHAQRLIYPKNWDAYLQEVQGDMCIALDTLEDVTVGLDPEYKRGERRTGKAAGSHPRTVADIVADYRKEHKPVLTGTLAVVR